MNCLTDTERLKIQKDTEVLYNYQLQEAGIILPTREKANGNIKAYNSGRGLLVLMLRPLTNWH